MSQFEFEYGYADWPPEKAAEIVQGPAEFRAALRAAVVERCGFVPLPGESSLAAWVRGTAERNGLPWDGSAEDVPGIMIEAIGADESLLRFVWVMVDLDARGDALLACALSGLLVLELLLSEREGVGDGH